VAVLVENVPLVYRLAVVVFKSAPADNGLVELLSEKPEASLGYEPTELVLKVIDFVLRLAGADGTAFNQHNRGRLLHRLYQEMNHLR